MATVQVNAPTAMEQFEDSAPAAEENEEMYYNDYDDDEEDDDFEDDDNDFGGHDFGAGGGGGGGGGGNSSAAAAEKKMNFSHSVSNSVSKMQNLEIKKRTLHTSRDDRATTEQCLDPRTRLMLFKMISNGMLDEIDGCLSTGKEANVYYAKAGRKAPSTTVTEFAIKIYKTSILVFKDRDKYVSGEHRWRRGYCKSNPRKMVKVWAEKEMRNYRRIHQAGIPCPEPIFLKTHILLMEFLGVNGWPSPRLKDAGLSEKHMREAYVQTILILRHMYQRCKLVHGDFSEYNLLWHNSRVYVIDVSQSVETDHPAALDFLRKDASNVNDYFQKVGKLDVMTTRQLFEFITTVIDEDVNNQDAEMEFLEKIMKEVGDSLKDRSNQSEQDQRKQDQQEAVDEAVFMSSFLPRSLNQVADYDIKQLQSGKVEESYAHAVAALTGNKDVVDAYKAYKQGEGLVTPSPEGGKADDGESDDDDSDDEDGSEDSEDEDDEGGFIKVPRTQEELESEKAELKASRKANKKAVKEAKTEKRKTKIKKKDKKRAINKAKAGNRKHR
ncbi:unnamed protein product [Cylindrotheca closterium]|uniref:Serine/threonine-protein kinase RIO1 n=1 Tax=Cylindrotheca closterium TaxID=2856 RepID=A0AAD2FQK6_9STRA|nr:unnamed protein product [Cylindrotheca closterium]